MIIGGNENITIYQKATFLTVNTFYTKDFVDNVEEEGYLICSQDEFLSNFDGLLEHLAVKNVTKKFSVYFRVYTKTSTKNGKLKLKHLPKDIILANVNENLENVFAFNYELIRDGNEIMVKYNEKELKSNIRKVYQEIFGLILK